MLGIPAAEASSHMQMPDLGSRTDPTDCERLEEGSDGMKTMMMMMMMMIMEVYRRGIGGWQWWGSNLCHLHLPSFHLRPKNAATCSRPSSTIGPASAQGFAAPSADKLWAKSASTAEMARKWRLQYRTPNGVSKRKHLNQHQISKPWLLNQVFNSMSKGQTMLLELDRVWEFVKITS